MEILNEFRIMITEDYVSFGVAKLLKEKGFDEPCEGFYVNSGVLSHTLSNANNSKWDEEKYTIGYISAPSLGMAMKWLREVHSIDISIDIRFWTDDEGVDVKSWRYTVYRTDEIEDFGQSDTYEEAAEAAIKSALENLI